MPVRLSDPNLWKLATDPATVHRDRGLVFMVIPITARMEILYRTGEELFSTTVSKAFRKMPFLCAINGIQYSVSNAGLADALVGGDPIPASQTMPDGLLVSQGKVIGGRSAPQMFYLAHDYVGGYNFGQGDPPLSAARGVGGLGPIIISGLPYGVGNRCKRPANCPPTGPVPEDQKEFLTQRNNATYGAQQNKGASVGKTIVATNKQAGRILIIVQRNGSAGVKFDEIKGWLLSLRCDNAVFLDGSDSAMLHARGFFEVTQGPDKDETNTVGLAFYL